MVAAGTGFVALSYEILWIRVMSYVDGGTPWTFGCMLGSYLAGVALASRECRKHGERHPRPEPLQRVVLARLVMAGGVLAYMVVPALAALAPARAWPAALVLLAVAAGTLGAALPLTAHLAIPPDGRAGARLSYVYLADIAGSAAGSVLTGYFLLDGMRLASVSSLLATLALSLGAALVATAGLPARTTWRWTAAAVAVLGACVVLGPALHDRLWERLKMHGPGAATERYAEVIENRHGIIAVTVDGVVMGGGVYDGAFSTDVVHDRNGIFRAYALAALHPAPRRVLFIGLGSGSWAQVLANLPGVEAVTVVEINPGYVELVGRHPEVRSMLSNPRVEIQIDDARRWLLRHPERRFDAIVSNSTFHWREHATNLLSLEFVRLAKSRLAEGGLFYFNATGALEPRDTALAAFAHGALVGSFFAASDRPLGWDGARLARALESMRIDGRPVLDLGRASDRERLAALVRAAPPPEARRNPPRVITDDNMLTEWLGWPVGR